MTASSRWRSSRLAGPGTWWLSAVAGHVGATFIAYAGIVAVYVTDRSDR